MQETGRVQLKPRGAKGHDANARPRRTDKAQTDTAEADKHGQTHLRQGRNNTSVLLQVILMTGKYQVISPLLRAQTVLVFSPLFLPLDNGLAKYLIVVDCPARGAWGFLFFFRRRAASARHGGSLFPLVYGFGPASGRRRSFRARGAVISSAP